MIKEGGGRVLQIHIAGREILGRPRDLSRPYGLFVKRDGFQGWKGVSNTRREALARAVEHGEHDAPVYLGARVITIDGWVIGRTERELEHEEESLVGLLSGQREQITIDHQGLTRWANGRVMLAVADPGSRIKHGVYAAAFQVQMTCADPRRYGESQAFPPAGTARAPWVSHRGNFPAYPVIEIPAAPADYSISSPGGTFTVTGATAGGTHAVDLRRGRVFRNGVEMLDVGVGNLWAIPPGARWQHALSVPGVVRITDTYI